MGKQYENEADLVRAFVAGLGEQDKRKEWTVYAETAGWDLLLVHTDGFQLGIEAKMRLNPKVIDQALAGALSRYGDRGPDYRGVLVPEDGKQHHMERICTAIGLGIITMSPKRWHTLNLPDERHSYHEWPNWLPAERCALPDYVPDVEGGHSSPVQLTPWKIKALRLMAVLERRGYVTRDDMKRIGISPTLWTQARVGHLSRAEHGYVKGPQTPNYSAQHPTIWEQVVAEIDQWAGPMGIRLSDERQGNLL